MHIVKNEIFHENTDSAKVANENFEFHLGILSQNDHWAFQGLDRNVGEKTARKKRQKMARLWNTMFYGFKWTWGRRRFRQNRPNFTFSHPFGRPDAREVHFGRPEAHFGRPEAHFWRPEAHFSTFGGSKIEENVKKIGDSALRILTWNKNRR